MNAKAPAGPASDRDASAAAASTSRTSPWRLIVMFLVGAGLLIAVYFLTRSDPQALYLRARDAAAVNPDEAESLLYRSIAAADDDFPAAQLLLCDVLGRQGRWVEARGSFSLIKDPARCDADEMVRLAEDAVAAKEPILPDMVLQAAIAAAPDHVPALRLLIQSNVGRYPEHELIRLCKHLAKLDVNDSLPWLVMAKLYQRQRSVPKAIDAWQEALRRDVDPAQTREAKTQLVELYLQIEDAAAARTLLNELPRETEPIAHSLRLKNARLLRLENRPREALAEVAGVLESAPESIAALTLRGVLYMDLDEPERAIVDLERVVNGQAAVKEAHYKLAQAYRRVGELEKSQRHLEISARLNRLSQDILALEGRFKREPNNVEVVVQLSDLCRQAGLPERAAHWQELADSLRRNGR